jgi:hypothetical protein
VGALRRGMLVLAFTLLGVPVSNPSHGRDGILEKEFTMKNIINTVLLAIALLTSSLVQSAPNVSLTSDLAPADWSSTVSVLDELEMQAMTGKFLLLPWIFGVTGMDLALISVYWGIYAPNYVEGDPGFNSDVSGSGSGS